MAETMTVEELVERMEAHTPPILIDVRFGQIGQIPGAKHIPVTDLEDMEWDLPLDGELVVFCQFGKGGSEYAAEVLEEKGHQHVYKLVGGMDAWNAFWNEKSRRG